MNLKRRLTHRQFHPTPAPFGRRICNPNRLRVSTVVAVCDKTMQASEVAATMGGRWVAVSYLLSMFRCFQLHIELRLAQSLSSWSGVKFGRSSFYLFFCGVFCYRYLRVFDFGRSLKEGDGVEDIHIGIDHQVYDRCTFI